jgi:hypothetical protein
MVCFCLAPRESGVATLDAATSLDDVTTEGLANTRRDAQRRSYMLCSITIGLVFLG